MEDANYPLMILFVSVPWIVGIGAAVASWWLRTRQNGNPTVVAVLAGIAGLMIPGAPQLANGEVKKGLLVFVLSGLLWWILMGWIVGLYAAYDGAVTAHRLSSRRATSENAS